jgi:hypothetical protein
MDLIDRQAAIDALRARFGVDFDYGKWWSSTHVLAAIESVPPVNCSENPNRWIPVSELPEKAGRYVVVISGTSDDNIDTAYYAGGMWYKSKIKAWMPVPPYKEESEVNNG